MYKYSKSVTFLKYITQKEYLSKCTLLLSTSVFYCLFNNAVWLIVKGKYIRKLVTLSVLMVLRC